jgi:hypothetical protein
MDSQLAPLIRWFLDSIVVIGFVMALAIPAILGMSVAAYTVFAMGYAIGYLFVPFLTWGFVLPAPRKADRNELESLCVRRCRLWHFFYTINGTRYLLPQFVSSIGWCVVVVTVTLAMAVATIVIDDAMSR